MLALLASRPLSLGVMRTERERPDIMKKDEERWALDRFLALLPESGLTAIQPHEEPDFIALLGPRRIGIEMTRLHWRQTVAGRPRQEQESLRRHVRRLAEQLYADRGPAGIQVSVHFNPHVLLNKVAVERVATHIANWAAAHVPASDQSFQEEYDWLNRDYFPEELTCLRIHRGEWISRPRFSLPDADYVPELAISDVQRALDAKGARHSRYLVNCDEAWLVISINTDRLSMTFEVSDGVTGVTYKSPFARVFLLQHMTSQLSELRTERATGQDA